MKAPKTPHIALDLRRLTKLEPKTTVRLHPRRGRGPRGVESKMGGSIAWPGGEPWPSCPEHQTALVPVLQLRRTDVPELACPRGAAALQLLWCPRDHAETGYAPWAKAWWRTAAEMKAALATMPRKFSDAVEEYVPVPCRLFPERVTEYPSSDRKSVV